MKIGFRARWRSGVLLFAIALLHAGPVPAQNAPIRIVLGFPAGAGSDILSRTVAEHMRQSLGQPVIVENRPGAGGIVANDLVKSAAPDGTNLLMTPVATMSIYPHSYGEALRYDPFRDFTPVAHLSAYQLGIAVAASVPAGTLAEYVALVRKDRNAGFYASAAAGSIPHFLGVMFARAAGIELTHVPYKGSANVMQALAANEISAASTTVADIGTLVKSGKARLLAVGGAQRAGAFPGVPTFKEAGYDIQGEGWYGLFAPAGTPRAAVERLAAAAITAIRDPVIRQRLEQLGLEPTGLGPAELAAIMKADYEIWGPVIRASGFKASN